jgi:tyrosine ammonia-lyase
VIIDKEPYIIHGGNFYGQHIASASDALVTALVKIGILLERQLARITDENLSKGLPPFLQFNPGGLNSGFMGAQVTASALLAEMRINAMPASIQSVPTNGNNQDVNTMGTIAARKAAAVLQDLAYIVSIHSLAVAQAADLLADEFKQQDASPLSHAYFAKVRSQCQFLKVDRPLSDDIKKLANFLLSTN